MWRWRDWVINANRNQPFDQFTLNRSRTCPNHRRAENSDRLQPQSRANTETASCPKSTRWVRGGPHRGHIHCLHGPLLGCARCHNHNYDPFTQKEFYRVFAYFNNVRKTAALSSTALSADVRRPPPAATGTGGPGNSNSTGRKEACRRGVSFLRVRKTRSLAPRLVSHR